MASAASHNRDDELEAQFQQELQLALEASLSMEKSQQTTDARTDIPSGSKSADTASKPSFLNDRAQMEKERLERLKRTRGEEEASAHSSSTQSGIPPSKRHRNSPPPPISAPLQVIEAEARVRASSSIGGSKMKSTNFTNSSSTGARFWKSELRPIANRHVDRDVIPPIRMSDILSPVRPSDPPNVCLPISHNN